MMSSTKPEVHNVSQRRQRKTEPRPTATCKKWQKSRVWFRRYPRGQTDTHTNVLITILRNRSWVI